MVKKKPGKKTGSRAGNPAKELEAWFDKVFDRKNLSSMTEDMRKNASSFFSSLGGKSGIVSRSEFEAQKKAVSELAKAIAKLEAKLDKLAGKKPATKKAAKKAKPRK